MYTRKIIGYGLIAVVLALAFTACDDGSGGGGNVAELEVAIQAAYDAKFNVKETTDAVGIVTGRYWVTAAEMKALNDAIEAAEVAKAIQTTIDTAKTNLQSAIAAFNTAKKQGTAAAITLSGTITVKNNGQAVPYVVIVAHDFDWIWREYIKVPSPAENTPWSMDIAPFSESTEVIFHVMGYNDNTYRVEPVFLLVPSHDSTTFVHDQSINNIAIDLANLKLITLSGTLNVSYDGKPLPSVALQIHSEDWHGLGEVIITQAGNNTSWSLTMPAFDVDTNILISAIGFDTITPWIGEFLFAHWPLPDLTWTVKDQNVTGLTLNLGEMKDDD
jgi:hypothetical protein